MLRRQTLLQVKSMHGHHLVHVVGHLCHREDIAVGAVVAGCESTVVRAGVAASTNAVH